MPPLSGPITVTASDGSCCCGPCVPTLINWLSSGGQTICTNVPSTVTLVVSTGSLAGSYPLVYNSLLNNWISILYYGSIRFELISRQIVGGWVVDLRITRVNTTDLPLVIASGGGYGCNQVGQQPLLTYSDAGILSGTDFYAPFNGSVVPATVQGCSYSFRISGSVNGVFPDVNEAPGFPLTTFTFGGLNVNAQIILRNNPELHVQTSVGFAFSEPAGAGNIAALNYGAAVLSAPISGQIVVEYFEDPCCYPHNVACSLPSTLWCWLCGVGLIRLNQYGANFWSGSDQASGYVVSLGFNARNPSYTVMVWLPTFSVMVPIITGTAGNDEVGTALYDCSYPWITFLYCGGKITADIPPNIALYGAISDSPARFSAGMCPQSVPGTLHALITSSSPKVPSALLNLAAVPYGSCAPVIWNGSNGIAAGTVFLSLTYGGAPGSYLLEVFVNSGFGNASFYQEIISPTSWYWSPFDLVFTGKDLQGLTYTVHLTS